MKEIQTLAKALSRILELSRYTVPSNYVVELQELKQEVDALVKGAASENGKKKDSAKEN